MFKGIGLFLIALLAMAMTGTLAGTAHAQTSYCSFLIDGTEYLEFPNIIKQGARVRANCPLGLIDGELKISSELEGRVINVSYG